MQLKTGSKIGNISAVQPMQGNSLVKDKGSQTLVSLWFLDTEKRSYCSSSLKLVIVIVIILVVVKAAVVLARSLLRISFLSSLLLLLCQLLSEKRLQIHGDPYVINNISFAQYYSPLMLALVSNSITSHQHYQLRLHQFQTAFNSVSFKQNSFVFKYLRSLETEQPAQSCFYPHCHFFVVLSSYFIGNVSKFKISLL